jgi:hypothetical protein
MVVVVVNILGIHFLCQLAIISIGSPFLTEIVEDDSHIQKQNRIDQCERDAMEVENLHVVPQGRQ